MKPVRKLIFVIAVLFTCVMLPTPGLRSQEAPAPSLKIESILPADTIAFLTVHNVERLKAELKDGPGASFLRDKDMAEFLAPFSQTIDELIMMVDMQLGPMTGHSLDELLSCFSGQVALGVIDIRPELFMQMGMGESPVDFFISFDTAGKNALFKEISGNFLATMTGGMPLAETEYNGTKYSLFPVSMQVQLAFTFIENTFILTTSEASLKLLIDNYTGRTQNADTASLASSPLFKKVSSKTGGDGQSITGYFNLESLMLKLDGVLPPEGAGVREVINELGLYDIKAVGFGSICDPKENSRYFYVHSPLKTRGIPAILDAPQGINSLVSMVPSNALSFNACNFDFNAAWTKANASAAVIAEKTGNQEMLNTALEYVMEMFGIDVNRLLKSIGAESVTYAYKASDSLWGTRWITLLKLRNKEEFLNTIKDYAAGDTKISLRELVFEGRTIYYTVAATDVMSIQSISAAVDEFMTNMDSESKMQVMMEMIGIIFGSSSAFMFEGDIAVISNNVQGLKRYIKDSKVPVTPMIETEAFKKASAGCSLESVFFTYVNSKDLNTDLYNMFVDIGFIAQPLLRRFNIDADFNKLPLAEDVAKYFSDTFMVFYNTDEGFLFKQKGSSDMLTTTVTVTAVTAVVAAIAIPNMLRPRQQSIMMEDMGVSAPSSMLQSLSTIEELWSVMDADLNGKADFWTKDLAGLYALQDSDGMPLEMITLEFAQADYLSAAGYLMDTIPYEGYYFCVVANTSDGTAYAVDIDGDGTESENDSSFAFCAFPSEYGITGTWTYIMNESGVVYMRDRGPEDTGPITQFPSAEELETMWMEE